MEITGISVRACRVSTAYTVRELGWELGGPLRVFWWTRRSNSWVILPLLIEYVISGLCCHNSENLEVTI